MKANDIKPIIKTALSLFIICAVSAGILAAVNLITAPMIEENNLKNAEEAKLLVLPLATGGFTEKTDENGNTYYIGSDGSSDVGYVFTTSAAGYGGQIEIMTGINNDGTVTGISILSINETPGLGMNAKKDSFLSQYVGNNGPFTVIKNATASENEINAMTSATITTNAVTKAVNEAIGIFDTVKEG